MKRNTYPKPFEDLWAVFLIAADKGLIGAGGKAAGYEAYKVKKCTPEDAEYLIKCLFNQINAKVRLRQTGEFCPQLQAPERWIRNERFDDDTSNPEPREAIRPASRRDQAREAIAALTGEGEANSDGTGETGFLRLVERP